MQLLLDLQNISQSNIEVYLRELSASPTLYISQHFDLIFIFHLKAFKIYTISYHKDLIRHPR